MANLPDLSEISKESRALLPCRFGPHRRPGQQTNGNFIASRQPRSSQSYIYQFREIFDRLQASMELEKFRTKDVAASGSF